MKKDPLQLYTKWLLIDGFNLIYKFDTLHSLMTASCLEEAMVSLLEKVELFSHTNKKEITVVFDGKKREGLSLKNEQYKSITVHYSINKKADDIIMSIVKNSKTPADYTVITSDKKIISFVKRRGSSTMLSENFEKLVSDTTSSSKHTNIPSCDKDINVKLNEEEISFWEKMFSSS